jgi:hypothetical protein
MNEKKRGINRIPKFEPTHPPSAEFFVHPCLSLILSRLEESKLTMR